MIRSVMPEANSGMTFDAGAVVPASHPRAAIVAAGTHAPQCPIILGGYRANIANSAAMV